MRKILLSLPFVAMTTISSFATEPGIVVHTPEGGQTVYPFEQFSRMKPTSNGLQLYLADGIRTIPYSQIQIITIDEHGEVNGIVNVDGEQCTYTLRWDGKTGIAEILGAPANTPCSIFDMSGRRFATINMPADGIIDLSTLNKNVYILTIGQQSYKIIKL